MTTAIGKRLRDLRRARAWSQAELARRVDVQRKQLSHYESGTHTPSVEVLVRIAKALDVSLDDLVFDGATRPPVEVRDSALIDLFRGIDQLPDEERDALKVVLGALVRHHRLREFARQ